MSNADQLESEYTGSEIAIIGMAGRFPGARDLDVFWRNLRDGVESIARLSEAALLEAGVDAAEFQHPNYVRAAPILDDIAGFDAALFGFSPLEAEITDPQQRIFMECCWEALEDAGYNPDTYRDAIGVFGGSRTNTYVFNLVSDQHLFRSLGVFQVSVGNDLASLATRVSYKLNLKGPSYAVHTACSTSLVAVHLACQSLLIDECQMAIAGGVAINVPHTVGYLYEPGGVLAPDGHCRAFDKDAQGTVFGSGAGAVLLKRLDDALRDGDTIHAVIKGSATNNDGAGKASFTAPSVDGQAAVIIDALTEAEVSPETISYVEAHGTGTALGDPIELRALTKAFRTATSQKGYCAIGSVKTNVGHLDAAAGMSSLLKTVLALKHQQIPPSLNYRAPNPRIDFASSPFYVNTELRAWQHPDGDERTPLRAGVSSFGFGGTNAHVIVEQAPPPEERDEQADRPQLLLLSAMTPTALETMTTRLQQHLATHPTLELADVAYTLQVGRKEMPHRQIVVAEDRQAALAALAARDPAQAISAEVTVSNRPVAFLFPGQGAQYVGMGQALYEQLPVFRATVDQCCALLQPLLDLDLRTVLYPAPEQQDEAAAQLRTTALAQPALFVVEYALAQLWLSLGVRPQALLGHSVGEYVAATLAGVFTLDDALRLIATRGRLMQSLPGGAMLSVALPEAELTSQLDAALSLAAVNGPRQCVVAGPDAAVAALAERLQAQGVTCRRLHTSHAFHSPMMEPILDSFTAEVGRTELRPPQIPFVSNVSGTWITAAEATDPHYWTRHLRQTVRFGAGLQQLTEGIDRVLLEVGPGSTLSTFARQQPGTSAVLTSVRHPSDQRADLPFLLTTLGQLWLHGITPDWAALHAGAARWRVPLPTYPFERQRYWIDPAASTSVGTPRGSSALSKNPRVSDWFYLPVWHAAPLEPIDWSTQRAGWLIFADECGLGDRLAAQLRQAAQPTIVVRPGPALKQLDPETYQLDPGSAAHYAELITRLLQAGLPTRIVHLSSVTPADQPAVDSTHFAQMQRCGFFSLLYLAQALLKAGVSERITLGIVTNQMQAVSDDEQIDPAKATLLGPCKVIPQELLNVNCRSIDIQLPVLDAPADELAGQLLAELSTSASDSEVAYRSGTRWVKSFKATPGTPLPDGQSRLRPGGAYLITGGLGNLGLLLAEHLARSLAARLVLIGRTALPERAGWDNWLRSHDDADPISQKLRAVAAIEAAGGEVLLVSADVGDVAALRAAIALAEARWGRLHGVIHAAGITSDDDYAPISETTPAECAVHFQAKAHGLIALEQALQGRQLDVALLFSSLAAVLGGLSYVAYSAANAYLDAFARWARQRSATPWISVNWDSWHQRGVADGTLGATLVELAITPDEGISAIQHVLSIEAPPQIVVSTSDLQTRLDQWVKLAALSDGAAAAGSPARLLPGPGELEQRLVGIWQRVLGVARVGLHDNFFDLGGNSLSGMQLLAELKRELDVHLSPVALFEAPTISALSKLIRPAAPAAGAARSQPPTAPTEGGEIAIIAMDGRFPGARNLDEFWHNLQHGVESVTYFTDDELAESVSAALLADPRYVKARPVLADIEQFDAAFFGYTPREAELMDPQHRIFLECAWTALEQAGYSSDHDCGAIGVYAGASLSTYLLNLYSNADLVATVDPLQTVIGNAPDSLTTSVSYKLNLKGPSLAVQTFCSTSLVAVHLACQSIARGECDLALAGGVSVLVPQDSGYQHQEGGILSPDGHSRTFDAEAQGTVFGNGVGVVVLKRLDAALRDGDTIHAVIKGSAINNDGAVKVGYTAPSVDGQAAVIRDALSAAQIDPATISYVEAHGTATALGDPIEVAALTKAFRHWTDRSAFCALGSVKTNVGHLDRAAGVTALIKTVLALRHQQIPPSLHFTRPNPKIDFAASPFFVNTALRPWPSDGTPRRAGVSALGFGGTNAHVIIEEAPEAPAESAPVQAQPWQLIQLSAKTPGALATQATNLAAYLRAHPTLDLADVAYTLQVGRRSFSHRLALVCQSLDDAAAVLETQNPQRMLRAVQETSERPVAFLFPGQGAQYVGMGQALYEQLPVFRATVDQCCALLQPLLDLDLRTLLYPAPEQQDAAAAQLRTTAITQPALFVVEYALAQLWISAGVRPAALLGHSIGEYVAATLAGVFTLDDALALVVARGRLMQSCPPGAMLSIVLSEAATREQIAALHRDHAEQAATLAVAAVNTPTQSVVAGSEAAVAALAERLQAQGVTCRRLHTSHAFHSALLDPIQEAFAQEVARVPRAAPQIPFISNVSGTWITAAEASDPHYWAQQLRQPVRFAAGAQLLLGAREQVLLEVGPGTTLSTLARQQPGADQASVVLHSLRHPQQRESDVATVLAAAGRLWLQGLPLDWAGLYADQQRRRVPLPTYPFERQRYWIAPGAAGTGQAEQSHQPGLAERFYTTSWKRARATKPQAAAQGQTWLVFTDRTGLGAALGRQLRQPGDRVIMVERGAQLEQRDALSYSLAPDQLDGYVRLLRELRETERWPSRVVHLWGIDDDSQPSAPAQGWWSLLLLGQALAALHPDQPLPLWTIADSISDITGAEQVRPEQTSLLAACKTINTAYPELLCRCVELALTGSSLTALAQQLAGEVASAAPEWWIAYRGQHRWTPALEALPAAPSAGLALRDGGVYLVTAGLDQPAIQLAEQLAQATQARLVLLEPQGLPERDEWQDWLAPAGPSAELRQRITDQIVARQRLPFDLQAQRATLDRVALDLAQQLPAPQPSAELEALADQLCAGYICRYFAEHQIEAAPGLTISRADLQRRLGIIPKYDQFFALMLTILEHEGVLTAAGDQLRFADAPIAPEPVLHELRQRYPQAQQSFAVLDHCVRSYGPVLAGAVDPISVLYPGGSSEMMRAIEANQLQFSNIQACRALATRLVAQLAMQPAQRPLRILEVGMGEGQLTWELAALLQDQPVEYHATDISRSFILNAEQRAAAAGYRFMRFGVLDITRDALAQGYDPCGYDVIIAAEVVHTAPTITATLGHLQQLLVPQGLLLLLEATHVQRWAHMVWGLLDGWWHFSDAELRGDGPLLQTEQWQRVLRQQGFGASAIYPQPEAGSGDPDYALLIAQQAAAPGSDAYRAWLSASQAEAIDQMQARINRVRSLEQLGAEVLVVPASRTDRAQLRAAIDAAQTTFGALHGVIHVPDYGLARPLEEQDYAHCAGVVADTLAGMAALTQALADTSLELALLVTPPAASAPEPLPLATALSSLQLDAWAISGASAIGWTVLNWALTDGSPEHGTQTLRQLSTIDAAPQILVLPEASASGWNTLRALKASGPSPQHRPAVAHARPNLGNAYVAPTSELETRIAQVWAEVLGMAELGIHDSFLELGGDSLQATQLLSRLRATCGVDVPLSTFFETPTIAGLAQVIDADQASQEDDAAAILALLQQLSPEEVLAEIEKRQQLLDDSIAR